MSAKMNTRDNVRMTIEGTTLVVRVELDPAKVELVPSSSGKTRIVATTGGAAKLEDGTAVNLTVYRK
jgi:hypothetical protein